LIDAVVGNTSARFEADFQEAKVLFESLPDHLGVVTIDSWNEWSEGSDLEPDKDTGLRFCRRFTGSSEPSS
jgi:hypothetical protein